MSRLNNISQFTVGALFQFGSVAGFVKYVILYYHVLFLLEEIKKYYYYNCYFSSCLVLPPRFIHGKLDRYVNTMLD